MYIYKTIVNDKSDFKVDFCMKCTVQKDTHIHNN
jgi:hypothetical protein